MRINNNLMAMNTHRQLGVANNSSAKSMEKLSSGFRINRAGDDAAGLAISEKMRGQIRGLNQASANAQDGISLLQTAEGALNETHAILQRMRELSVQSSTDTNTDSDRKEIQKEVDQLATEITRISTDTEFNTMKLLDGTYADKKFHIGANSDQSTTINVVDMGASALKIDGTKKVAATITEGTNTFDVSTRDGSLTSFAVSLDGTTVPPATSEAGAFTVTLAADATNADIKKALETAGFQVEFKGDLKAAGKAITATNVAVEAASTEKYGINVSTQDAANKSITTINTALENVSAERSKLGAMQNRLEHTIKNLDTSSENLQASEARIRDVDMAKEMMEQTKQNILAQASTAMLAQANQAPQGVLQLLR